MANYWENENYVRDLQAAAKLDRSELPEDTTATDANLAGSRAAMLSLIDRLARQSVPLLSLIGVSIASIAGFYTLSLPGLSLAFVGRLSLWLVIVLACLTFTAHRLYLFRQGFAYSGHPFTWRAHYTATLSVLSSAFGSGAVLLTPASIPASIAILICGAILLTAIIFGVGHLAHRPAAVTASLPAAVLALTAALFHILPLSRELLQQFLFLWAGGVAITVACALWSSAQAAKLVAETLRNHPRNEMLQISARHKKVSAAYNPFRIKLQQSKDPQSERYNPSEL